MLLNISVFNFSLRLFKCANNQFSRGFIVGDFNIPKNHQLLGQYTPCGKGDHCPHAFTLELCSQPIKYLFKRYNLYICKLCGLAKNVKLRPLARS